MRFIFIKDPHFDLTGPPSYRGDYYADLIAMFDQIKEIAAKIKAKALLIPGDIFLKMEPNQIRHTLVSNMSGYFKDYPIPILGIIGNHDARKGLEHYHTYPIGVLIKAGVYQYLDEMPAIFEEGGVKVKIGGVSYCKDHYYKVVDYKKGDEDYLVLLAHFFISKKPGKFFSEKVYGFDEFKDAQFDVLAVGHEHTNTGIFEHNGKHFIDAGAITRVSASESDRRMVPQIVAFSITKEGFKSKTIPLKYRPAEEVFGDIVEPDFIEEVPDWSEFEDKLDGIMSNPNVDRITENIELLDYPDEVKTKAIDYIRANN